MWIAIIVSLLLIFLVSVFLVASHFYKVAFVRDKEKGDVFNIDSDYYRYLTDYKDVIEPGIMYIKNRNAQSVYCKSFDGLKLHALYFDNDSLDTIILFHGYRSSGVKDFSCAVETYSKLGLNVLLVDQRSHGESEGKLITYGVKERYDVLSWIKFVNQNFKNIKSIFLGGMSMGATTVLLASEFDLPQNVKGIIADCGFTSPADIIKKVAKQSFNINGDLVIPIMNLMCKAFGKFSINDVSTEKALKKSKTPILFFHGESDDFVPVEMSRYGYKAAVCEKYIYTVPGASHGLSYIIDTEGVTQQIQQFISKHR